MLTLLLAAAAAQIATGTSARSAVEAERAFARDAQRVGQWTAFRKYADLDAVLFTPQVVWAHDFLAGRKDPPVPVQWWPAQSYVSCDGRIAVNTGPWVRDGGKRVGYFTTVWQRQDDGKFRWILDQGDALAEPLAAPELIDAKEPGEG